MKSWMQTNFLNLNCDKSQILNPKSINKITNSFRLSIDVSDTLPCLHPPQNNFSFKHHLNHITRTSFFHRENIALLRPSLSFSAAENKLHCRSAHPHLNLRPHRSRPPETPLAPSSVMYFQFKMVLLMDKALHNQGR